MVWDILKFEINNGGVSAAKTGDVPDYFLFFNARQLHVGVSKTETRNNKHLRESDYDVNEE